MMLISSQQKDWYQCKCVCLPIICVAIGSTLILKGGAPLEHHGDRSSLCISICLVDHSFGSDKILLCSNSLGYQSSVKTIASRLPSGAYNTVKAFLLAEEQFSGCMRPGVFRDSNPKVKDLRT